ncbi:MarR family transcriptional regulator [Parapedobacter pyrenivorans]|uniref:MarR family transcriptional regulator n=1 Tax=Parapedobacter pyrenivorans TaxID=1305674 RepID=A0A917HVJ2_9SPHI|nr:helix-turn-helix domain-containing protein [Parapedobacter pyrenivorans]GGG92936.1 MarR family transcriptional regulator [Parapedobacter pyrenivorans]
MKIKSRKNVSPEDCNEAMLALRDSIEIWGGKWKLMILLYLTIKANDKNCFMEMVRGIPGISGKMLSKELKDLEMNRLVKHIVHDTKPVTVEYTMTEYGKSFVPVAEQLLQWGMSHRKAIRAK